MSDKPQINEFNYRDCPHLAKYIDRIGAEQKNFRRFMVVEHHANGYYSEKVLIKIDAEGTVTCSDKSYEPTEEEQKAIKVDWLNKSPTMPKWIMGTDELVKDLYKKEYAGNSKDSTLFVFHSREHKPKEGNVIMVQQRIDKGPGEKWFINWTFWSDGAWRRMEPDQPLPLWKPDMPDGYERGNKKIMIHEGGKTAKHLTAKVKDAEWLATHPWAYMLSEYEHWGMIGGALVPHRTNYEELYKEHPAEVIYVCDNDHPGNSALQKVAENYGAGLFGVKFDARFKLGFDLADPLPVKFFDTAGKYIGPRFEDFVTFATYATRLIPNETGKGRPIAILNDHFAQEWYHCVQPEVFVHKKWPNLILNLNEFNNAVAPYSNVVDTARLVKKQGATKSAVLSYDPGKKPGMYANEDGSFINTHVPTRIERKPYTDAEIAPWLEFMDHLVPNEEDRLETLRWCATLVARKDIKMLYGLLLISEVQGIGKGTLGERVLAPLVGHTNVSYPSESEIVDSNYNYWAAHKRLAVVHEIYAGHSAKAYNKLKSIVTDQKITVQKKYQANYEVDNWVHIVACSNSARALQLSMDDRRWLVPRLTEDKRDNAYWHKLNVWLVGGGLEFIFEWAFNFLQDHAPVMRGESAPWTGMKKEIVEEAFSPGMQLVAHLLDEIKQRFEEDARWREHLLKKKMTNEAGALVFTDRDLQEYIKMRMYDGKHNERIEKPLTLRKVAQTRGWFVGKDKIWHLRWGRERYQARVISLRAAEARAHPTDLAEVDGLLPLDLATTGEAV